MQSLLTTTNEKNGNGQYRPLRKRNKSKKAGKSRGFRYLANNDLRMQFNTTKDPIYFAFECLEERSIPQLMGDFIQDSFFEITNFISKVTKK